MPTKELGKFGEDLAVNYLKEKGYKILERNWKTPPSGSGQARQKEIDVIAKKDGVIVFVEVKTLLIKNYPRKSAEAASSGNGMSPSSTAASRAEGERISVNQRNPQQDSILTHRFLPEESVGPDKRKNLIFASKSYLFSKKIPEETPWQIDIVSIEIYPDNKPKIHHFENEIFS